jgi:exopolysaccharide production protein ExoQ
MKLLESKFFAVITFIVFTSAVISLLLDSNNEGALTGDGNRKIQLIFAIIYVLLAFVCLVRHKYIIPLVKKDPWYIFLIIWAFTSVLWSENQDFAFRRFIAFLGTNLIGFYWAYRFKLKEMISIAFYAYSVISVLSLIFIYIFPTLGLHQDWIHYGLPRGVFTHKNLLGLNMAFALIINIIYTKSKKTFKNKLFGYLMIGLSFWLLIISTSGTAIFFSLISLFAVQIVPRVIKINRNLRTSFYSFASAFFVLTVYIFYLNRETILSSFGKDPTLTGRTELWKLSLEFIGERFFTGFGYQSFWSSSYGRYISSIAHWDILHAHNGLLELMLQLGMIGFLLFFFSFFGTVKKSYLLAKRKTAHEMLFPFLIIFLIICFNVTEANMLKPNSTHWILFVYASLKVRMSSTFAPNEKDEVHIRKENFKQKFSLQR